MELPASTLLFYNLSPAAEISAACPPSPKNRRKGKFNLTPGPIPSADDGASALPSPCWLRKF